jgi:hypothetical protein
MRFAHLKRNLNFRRLRLRGMIGARWRRSRRISASSRVSPSGRHWPLLA